MKSRRGKDKNKKKRKLETIYVMMIGFAAVSQAVLMKYATINRGYFAFGGEVLVIPAFCFFYWAYKNW